jgi:hypothetical protein
MVGWTLGILAALGLTWFVAAVAVPAARLVWHRHRFREGTYEERIDSFAWISRNRLRPGMAKREVDRIFGGPLEARVRVDDGSSPGITCYRLWAPEGIGWELQFQDGHLLKSRLLPATMGGGPPPAPADFGLRKPGNEGTRSGSGAGSDPEASGAAGEKQR